MVTSKQDNMADKDDRLVRFLESTVPDDSKALEDNMVTSKQDNMADKVASKVGKEGTPSDRLDPMALLFPGALLCWLSGIDLLPEDPSSQS